MDYNTAIDLSNTTACFGPMGSIYADDDLSGAGINMDGEETMAIVNSILREHGSNTRKE